MISFLKKLFCKSQANISGDGTTIYVGNLSYSITKTQLEAAFATFGNIASSRIIRDRQTGRSKGFGFVTFIRPADASKALTMDGSELRGRQVRVSAANERQDIE